MRRVAALLGLLWCVASPAQAWELTYEQLCERFRAENEATWDQLVRSRYIAYSSARMRFLYAAPDGEQAHMLLQDLRAAGYAAEMEYLSDGWMVMGTSPRMPLSKDALNDWTIEMIDAGMRHGVELRKIDLGGRMKFRGEGRMGNNVQDIKAYEAR